jgi:hypothetical protein
MQGTAVNCADMNFHFNALQLSPKKTLKETRKEAGKKTTNDNGFFGARSC